MVPVCRWVRITMIKGKKSKIPNHKGKYNLESKAFTCSLGKMGYKKIERETERRAAQHSFAKLHSLL